MKKKIDFSGEWPKNEEGSDVLMDLFRGKTWPEEYGLHVWRDSENVFLSIGFSTVGIPVSDFVDIVLILGIVGNVMTEDVCPDCVEERVNDELKYRTEFIEKQKQEEEVKGGENEGGRGGVSLR